MGTISSIFVKVALTKILNEIYASAVKMLDKESGALIFSASNTEVALEEHLNFVNNWSGEISFREIDKIRDTLNVFIQLKFYLNKQSSNFDKVENADKIELLELLQRNSNNIVLLGQPGAGKTTSMKFVVQSILYNEDFFPNVYKYPLVVRLRELNINSSRANPYKNNYLVEHILMTLNIQFTYRRKKIDEDDDQYSDFRRLTDNKLMELLVKLLDSLSCILILDGFDEISSSEIKTSVVNEIESISLRLNNTRIIITSRTGEFPYHFHNSATYEIAPLSDNQIYEFVSKWLVDKDKADDLYFKIKNSPFYDTTTRPLIVGYLCSIYGRYKSIPEKPKTIYKLVIELLLKEWDSQRNIQRVSRYSFFEVDRKFDFISCLAYSITLKYSAASFTTNQLVDIYKQIHMLYNLPINEAEQVVNEIESHNGLILQVGFDKFEFAHKSLQEFLSADYLTRLPNIPSDISIIEKLPHEFALCVAISSNPTAYFYSLVFEVIAKNRISVSFIIAFFKRIIIEKPDFVYDNILGYGYLYLFNSYYQNENERSKRDLNEDYEIFYKMGTISAIKLSLTKILTGAYKPTIRRKYTDDAVCSFGLSKIIGDPQISIKMPANIYILEKLFYNLFEDKT